MNVKSVHTTIPQKYHEYARKKKLRFSELLIGAIENEMMRDSNVIQDELEKIEVKKKELQQKLQNVQEQDKDKKKQLKAMHEGLMPE